MVGSSFDCTVAHECCQFEGLYRRVTTDTKFADPNATIADFPGSLALFPIRRWWSFPFIEQSLCVRGSGEDLRDVSRTSGQTALTGRCRVDRKQYAFSPHLR